MEVAAITSAQPLTGRPIPAGWGSIICEAASASMFLLLVFFHCIVIGEELTTPGAVKVFLGPLAFCDVPLVALISEDLFTFVAGLVGNTNINALLVVLY